MNLREQLQRLDDLAAMAKRFEKEARTLRKLARELAADWDSWDPHGTGKRSENGIGDAMHPMSQDGELRGGAGPELP